jgi:imidazoleglycerol-phosphate dehydratase
MAGKSPTSRSASVKRETGETSIRLELNLDGGEVKVETGVGFFDHMLHALATHGRMGLVVEAQGDLHVDQHHLVEDVGIVLGTAFREALAVDLKVVRFADAFAPLDDALARVVVDLSGRAYLHYGVEVSRPRVGDFDTDLVREFFQSFTHNARVNLHVDLVRGDNAHHQIEALFKATALALRQAVRRDSTLAEIPSTKGTIE